MPKMPRNMQNPLSQHVAFVSLSCDSWGTLLTRGVTGRRVALVKKTLEKRRVGEGEGKVLENYGKKERKRGNCEKKKKNDKKGEKRRRKEERGEKERRKGWEIHRAAGCIHVHAYNNMYVP